MQVHLAEPTYYSHIRKGIKFTWWQDRELIVLAFERNGLRWRRHVVHHPVSGVQTGYVRWWFGMNDIMDEEFNREEYAA